MKRILISVLTLLLLITGCSKKDKQLDIMSDAIIKMHQDYNYEPKGLNKENKKLLSEFKELQKAENKIINISKLDLFSDDIITEEPNSKGVYFENGNYYIKYNDLEFVPVNSEDYIATINVNGYIINLSKSDFPILFYETSGIDYKYRFIKKVLEENKVYYYYRSYGNSSMLTIEYELNDKKIENIDLVYDKYYLLDEIEGKEKKQGQVFPTIVLILILSGFIFFVVKIIKSYFDSKKI